MDSNTFLLSMFFVIAVIVISLCALYVFHNSPKGSEIFLEADAKAIKLKIKKGK